MTDDFWKRVNNLIKLKGINQQVLAESCDINYQTFRGWGVHKTYPNALQSYRIAKALDTTVEYLVYGNTEDNAEVIHTYSKIPEDRKQLALEILNILTK